MLVFYLFSSKSLIVFSLTFRSLTHFEFIFVYDVRKCSNFILFHVAVQFSQYHLLKSLSLPHCIFFPLLLKIRYPQVHGFISGLSVLFHWSIFLFLCQYMLTVLMTVPLQYNMKSGRLISPAPFFLKTALAFGGVFYFHMNCEFFLFQFCENCHW